MAKYEIGDKFLGWECDEIRVLATFEGRGAAQYWVTDGALAWTATEYSLDKRTKIEPFFEEKKNYKSLSGGGMITVWHVHKMALGPIAIAQWTDGTPAMLGASDFEYFKLA